MSLVPESERDAFTRDKVSVAANRAANDVLEAIDAPDEGVRDAINLVVNATLTYLEHPDATLQEAIGANYQLDGDDEGAAMSTLPTKPITRIRARELRPGDTYVDVFGNEKAVLRVAIHSPYHLHLSTVNASGIPCGDTLHPDEEVRVRKAPEGFEPEVFE